MRNPAINFEDLLRHLHSLVEGTYEDPSALDYPRYLAFFDLGLAESWDTEWWPDLMEYEKRYLRDIYATGTYAAGDEVYFQGTQLYYQALRASTSQACATGSPLAENSEYWAECKTSYSASDWVDGTAYVVGDQVFYPPTDSYYQCFQNHTASSTLTPNATGGDARWGVLAGFNRYVPWAQTGFTTIGDVADALDSDPRLGYTWEVVAWAQSQAGVQILEEVTSVWLHYRRRRPVLKGSTYSATATYAVGDQIYYTPTGGKGNLYDCVTATSAGDSPVSAAAKWQAVEIPQTFQNFLVWSAYARCLASDGKHDSVAGAKAVADDFLSLETDRLYRQSGQTPSLPMRTY